MQVWTPEQLRTFLTNARQDRLDLITLQQLLGYLLLDYQDESAIDTLGLYAARYAYLVTWPAAELLD
jgi:hypothetical protein